MQRWIFGLIAIAAVAGCKISKRAPGGAPEDAKKMTTPAKPIGTPEERAQLRAEVLAQVKPFADRPEYAVTDPEFVEPCIDNALHVRGDRMPTAEERAELVRSASVCVSNRLGEKDGLAAIAKRIAERYAHPVITREGDLVRIDAGVVAGSLHTLKITGILESPYLDSDGEWTTSEVVRHLKLGMAKYPDAQRYQAEVEIPLEMSKPDWTYVYDRMDDRIRMYGSYLRDKMYVSEKLGGDPAQVKSLSHWSLTAEPTSWMPVRSPKDPKTSR